MPAQFSVWKLCARFFNDLFWKQAPQTVRNDQKLHKAYFPNRALQQIYPPSGLRAISTAPLGGRYYLIQTTLFIHAVGSWGFPHVTLQRFVLGNSESNCSSWGQGFVSAVGQPCVWVLSATMSSWLALSSLRTTSPIHQEMHSHALTPLQTSAPIVDLSVNWSKPSGYNAVDGKWEQLLLFSRDKTQLCSNA